MPVGGMNMIDDAETWIVIVDNGKGRLLRGTQVPPGRFHLDENGSIENTWEAHQHGRPSPRVGKAGNTYASQGHENEERMSRFARNVTEWLERKTREHNIEKLTLFAPPRFLGALRQAWSPKLAARVSEHEGDLGYMSAGELARHRAIIKVLSAPNGKRP